MPLKDGDIITLDYEGRTEGILFDTTLEKIAKKENALVENRKYAPITCLLYTSPSPRDRTRSRMPSSA